MSSLLSPNISLRAVALNSVHATANPIAPELLVIQGGDGANREDTSYRSYRKHPLLF